MKIITVIEVLYRGCKITLEQDNDRPWQVTIESPSNIFESCNLFQDENDALEYGKLMIDKWYAESAYNKRRDTNAE